MPRFYLPDIQEPSLHLTGDEARHAVSSLRLKPGDILTVFNGQGSERPARVESVGKKGLTLTPLGASQGVDRRPARDVGVALAFPKARSRDLIVEKLVELGVRQIRPLVTLRSSGVPSLERLQAQALAACKQSGINTLPDILPPLRPRELPPEGRTLVILDPRGASTAPAGGRLTLLVGPEGGFDEVDLQGLLAERWCLGPQILRVETACLAAVARLLA